MSALATTIGGLTLPSPVMVAAGCGGTGRELHRYVDISTLPLLMTPSLRLEQSIGRLLPDVVPAPSGLVLATDRSRAGVREFVAEDLPWLASVGARVGLSVSGTTIDEFAEVVAVARDSDGFEAVRLVELELASPSRAAGGRPFGADQTDSAQVVRAVRERLPAGVALLAKLCADADVVDAARVVMKAGVDGVTLVSPPAAIAVDPATLRLAPGERHDNGGLVGPATRPVVAAAVARVRRAIITGRILNRAVVAVGGVGSGAAALELLALGADAVQVGSALLVDPFAVGRVEHELDVLLDAHGIASPDALVGRAVTGVQVLRSASTTTHHQHEETP